MSIECPAGACDYTGTMDAVEGHIGGTADALHEGVAVPDVRAYLDGEEGGGEAFEMPLWAWVAVAVVVVLLVYQFTGGNDQPDDQGDDQGVEAGDRATWAAGGR
jgi:hypothetical protein